MAVSSIFSVIGIDRLDGCCICLAEKAEKVVWRVYVFQLKRATRGIYRYYRCLSENSPLGYLLSLRGVGGSGNDTLLRHADSSL